MLPTKLLSADDDSGGQREIHAQAQEQSRENRHHLPQQQDDHARGNRQDGDRINQRGLHGALQFDVLLDVGRKALQNGVENTARLARFDEVHIQGVKDFFVLAHGGGQRRSAFHRRARRGQHFLKDFVFLLPGQNLQALHQGQSSIDHHGELAREDGQFLGIDASAERRQVKFLALLRHLGDVDLLALETVDEFRLARGRQLSAHGGSRRGWYLDM